LKECYPNNALTNIASEQHNETTVWSDKTIGESLDKGKGDYIEGEKILPGKFALYENYPNPFNPTTTIKYDLPEDVNVTVTIYNNNGQKVKELVNGFKTAGSYTVTFDGKSLASGMYFYKIEAGEFSKVKRMLLVK
ncbi:MAG: T9SS type A sorting domain-containing protein, partial [Calditrichota bacterium]